MRLGSGLLGLLLASASLHGEAAAGEAVDLEVHELPAAPTDAPPLGMRPAAVATRTGERRPRALRVPAAPAPLVARRQAVDEPGGSGEDEGTTITREADEDSGVVDLQYHALPRTWRDVQERVIFRVNVGYGLDDGPASGQANTKTGFDPAAVTDVDGNALQQTRRYFLGDAVLGSRGVLLPSMNTYFQSQYYFDVDGASAFATRPTVYDSQGGDALLVHSGYAEIDGLGGRKSPMRHLFVRAGRQFHYGSAMFVTNFDGARAAWDDEDFEVSGYFGRRVALFDDLDPGLLGGAGLKVRLERLVGLPAAFALDYLNFDGEQQYVEWTGNVEILDAARLTLLARLVDTGNVDEDGQKDGFGLGRLGARLRMPIGARLFLLADAEQKLAREVAYDFINPRAVDVVNVAQQFGFGLDEPEDSTRLGAGVQLVVVPGLETYLFGSANLVNDDEASTSGFDATYTELGAALEASLRGGLSLGGQAKLRTYSLDDAANVAGSAFDDTSGSGVKAFRELAGEARYSLGYRKISLSGGAYLRSYDLATPYATVDGDNRSGARLDAEGWIGPQLRLKGVFEVADPSVAYASDLDTLVSFRALMEAQF